MTDAATQRQIAAADPTRSTWLTANAGSGKTRVLTNRVARLLLAGTPPERILCLTYTRAAASEMQNRLLDTLGRWAMLPEDRLRAELAAMGETGATVGLDLAEARRLFARAIETPGGLKVQTIHAFCAAILRRFPIEAGVPVGFAELDERTDSQIRAGIIEAMAEADEPEITDLVTLHGDHDLDRFLGTLCGAQAGLGAAPDAAALWALAGLPYPYTEADLLAFAFGPGDRALLEALLPLLAAGSTNDAKAARTLAGLSRADDMALLAGLEGVLLYGATAKAPFGAKIGAFPTKDTRDRIGAPLMGDLNALMGRIEAARPRRLALDFANRSLALHRFAARFNALYEAEKRAHGWLSFDDLIARTEALLSRASMAQWVLFRLDGGIDHILVDEAQDTSPAQWRVIRHLAAEFTAGEGARATDAAATTGGRTLFVVGDPKQSIYSFQGADIAVFSERRAGFDADFRAVRRPMQDTTLDHSFRSSPAILGLVDAVFSGPAGAGVDGPTRHLAFRSGLPGRVDLWPPVPAADRPELLAWDAPEPQGEAMLPQVLLAEAIERQISAMLGQPLTDKNGVTRAIGPGDILILVQRRSGIFAPLLRVLKAAGHAVAGADRMKLTAELAVRDLRAVLAFLATPEDDLSLAAALRSPLFDVDEAALYRLAAGRPGYLWEALRDPDAAAIPALGAVRAVLSDMLAASVTLRPHDLLARMLIRHDGRRRLLARLGEEAAEGIDELLGQALTYEATGVPTLTGFLVWLGEDEIEVRRAVSGEGGGLIRVMTVHGAKGLESPVVILPECARPGPPRHQPLLRLPGAPAVMRGRKGERPERIEAVVAAEKQRQDEERRRLLYVALTRAENWLIVAAAGETGTGLDSWHAMVSDGFDVAATPDSGLTPEPLTVETLAAGEAVAGCGPVRRLAFGNWPAPAEAVVPDPEIPAEGVAAPPPAPIPDWLLHAPAPLPPGAPVARAATALGGAKVLPGDAALSVADSADPGAALLFGTRLHLLLEHLPAAAPEDRGPRAAALLAGAEGGLPSAAGLAALLDEAGAILDAPELAAVFALAPGETVLREVDWSADLDGLGPMIGTIDRLIVGPDRVLAVDYKSNHSVPADPGAVPDGILRQMAAYRGAISAIWPDRRAEVAVLWTRSRLLMPLPDALLDRALAGVPAPHWGARPVP